MLDLKGIIVPILTPKKENGVDTQGLERIAERAISSGVGGLFALGTTGEFRTLSLDHKKTVIDVLNSHVNRRVPLLVGVSSYSDVETNDLVAYCEKEGVSCLVSTPEFGSRTDPADLMARTGLPFLLYNNPAIHDNTHLPLDVVTRYAAHPQTIGIKDSSGNALYFDALMKLNAPQFRVFQGSERDLFSAKKQGAYGVVSGTANVCPDLFVSAWLSGDELFSAGITAARENIKKNNSKNYISALKMKLRSEGAIASAEMF